jgi:predicted nucleotidyltransferase component of viral defense system
MRPLRTRLQEARKRLGLPWEALERDYLLSWVLAGIGQIDSLRDTLVFKGGTALKKCYFGDYRFSEDLDFSGLEGVPTGAAMERAVREACDAASKLLDEYAPVVIACERYAEKDPHPGGQEAFTIRARLPWQKQPQTRVIIETTVDEKVLRPAQKRKIIHEYGEPLEAEVRVYALEEMVAEKLRAILQHVEKLEERGWSRSRARDYYDLWRVLGTYRNRMDLSDFASFLREKCAVRNVAFAGPEDFFPDRMLAYVEKTWDQWLGPLVPGLPTFQTVIGNLRPQIAELVPAGQQPRPFHR